MVAMCLEVNRTAPLRPPTTVAPINPGKNEFHSVFNHFAYSALYTWLYILF